MEGRHTRDRFVFSLPNQLAAWQETNELTAHLAVRDELVAVFETADEIERARMLADPAVAEYLAGYEDAGKPQAS